MARTGSFTAHLVKLVRELPDEAILDLVKHQLGALGIVARQTMGKKGLVPALDGNGDGAARERKPAEASAEARASANEERRKLLQEVERVVRQGPGLSASEVTRAVNAPQTRVAAALKELKLTQRIFQGGDRRFARYAATAEAAELASRTARENAAGPVRRPRRNPPPPKPAAKKKRPAPPKSK